MARITVWALECAYGDNPHTLQALFKHERTAKQYRDRHNAEKLNEPVSWTVRGMQVSDEQPTPSVPTTTRGWADITR